jgi:flagellar export protein FliJ
LAKELKAVEKLEEKKKDRYEAELNLKEKKDMDSWVAEQWPQLKLRRGAQ